LWRLGKHCRLPAEAGELACAGDRDHRRGLLALVRKLTSTVVETLLRAPSERAEAWVLADLPSAQRGRDARRQSVVMRSLDEQASSVPGAGLGDRPLATSLTAARLARHEAVSVSTPRRQRRRATESVRLPV
jgi:hypothetical protein